MPRQTIKTYDAELYIGWPTTPDDLERDQSVQVGVRYGVDARWAVLTSPEQVADLRRQLQRASRAVWPQQAPTTTVRIRDAITHEVIREVQA